MFDNLEDAFKQLDKKPYEPVSKTLALFRESLMQHGFTRRESMRLLDTYAKFLYEWAIEEALRDSLPSNDDIEET